MHSGVQLSRPRNKSATRTELNETFYDSSYLNLVHNKVQTDYFIPYTIGQTAYPFNSGHMINGSWFRLNVTSHTLDHTGILYSMDIPPNADLYNKYSDLIDQMQLNHYIDELTVLVEVAFGLYNPNTNTYYYVGYGTVFSPQGEVVALRPNIKTMN